MHVNVDCNYVYVTKILIYVVKQVEVKLKILTNIHMAYFNQILTNRIYELLRAATEAYDLYSFFYYNVYILYMLI